MKADSKDDSTWMPTADEEVLQELWQETLRRSPVTQSLLREVPVHLEFRRV